MQRTIASFIYVCSIKLVDIYTNEYKKYVNVSRILMCK